MQPATVVHNVFHLGEDMESRFRSPSAINVHKELDRARAYTRAFAPAGPKRRGTAVAEPARSNLQYFYRETETQLKNDYTPCWPHNGTRRLQTTTTNLEGGGISKTQLENGGQVSM